MLTWTLVIYLALPGPTITIEGFRTLEDCLYVGQVYRQYRDARVSYECRPVRSSR